MKLLTQPVGYLAAICSTAAFVPWRTESTEGVSFGMYAVFITGIALWLAYRMLTGNWPVIVANAVTLALAVCILAMKLRYN